MYMLLGSYIHCLSSLYHVSARPPTCFRRLQTTYTEYFRTYTDLGNQGATNAGENVRYIHKVNVGDSGRSLHSRSLFSDSRSNRLQTCAVFWYTIHYTQIPEPTLTHACTILTQDGKIPPNSTVGRLLTETVSMVPQIDSFQFEQSELTQPCRYSV